MNRLGWTNTLPEGWQRKPLRAVVSCVVSNVDKVSDDGEIPVQLCNYTDVYHNEFISPRLGLMRATASEAEIERFALSVDDVVITKDSETWDDIGVAALVVETSADLVCGYHLALLRPHTNVMHGAFLFRCLQAKPIQVQLALSANGVTRFGLPKSEIGAAVVPVPPLPQQRVIARYVGCETARLDALVAEKERLLDLLAEKRQALITHAVTRGLDPAAPVAGSGTRWLGDSPEHWTRCHLKRALDSLDYGVSAPVDTSGNIAVLRMGDIRDGSLDYSAVGFVDDVDERSRQLAEALERGVPIIITTLQKFPYVSRQLFRMAEERGTEATGVLPTRRCAVIIDEAHSSQGGETATALKGVLGGEELREEARKRAAEEGLEGEHAQELFLSMARRGRLPNLSFFAFTATPKHKTLKVFGRDGRPAHRYTMRQAIEEGFILDVLRHYTSYVTYYKLLKACAEDPHVERKPAARALARFLRLHPHNIAQKTEIMVEHFNAVTRHKIGGRAKAMVVTGSRLEAVRYKQSFDRYIQRKGYPIKSLVAFSGVVEDDEVAGLTYTEEQMNDGVREKELPEHFATPEYQVLLVAEKYQTGFDQPLLHTMYVDKRLAGIQAVQTLSRLNRTHALKEDTFVLDFINDRDEIRDAFETYYEGAAMGAEVDPARMYEVKGELDASGVYLAEEVDPFCAVYFKPRQRQSAQDHQAMNVALDPAVSRFAELLKEDETEAEVWRGKLHAFRNLYGFLSQVIPYQDSDLERLYVFVRHLGAKLPRRRSGPSYDFDDDVRLEYYRLQKISEGSIAFGSDDARALDGPTEVGSGVAHEESVPLSKLIDVVNDRFGTDFNEADQLFFEQIVEAAVADDELRQTAAVNPETKFELVFKNLIERLFVERMDQNEEIFVRYMNDPSFKEVVSEWLSSQAYRRLRDAEQGDEESEAAGLRIVAGRLEDRYVTCVPLVPLAVAAGAFGDPQTVPDESEWEWVEVDTPRRLRPGMFVAQVTGRSMEPMVPDGAYALFRSRVEGTRQGKTVLVELRGAIDPETGERHTLKRYESERVAAGDSWRHEKITLKPMNPEFDPIVITDADEGELKVVAELVEVLTAPSNTSTAVRS